MDDVVTRPDAYVATYCRLGQHAECQGNRAVLCACPCHVKEGPKRALPSNPPWAGPAGRSSGAAGPDPQA